MFPAQLRSQMTTVPLWMCTELKETAAICRQRYGRDDSIYRGNSRVTSKSFIRAYYFNWLNFCQLVGTCWHALAMQTVRVERDSRHKEHVALLVVADVLKTSLLKTKGSQCYNPDIGWSDGPIT